MPDLSDLVPFHSGQVENFYLLVLGQVQMYQVNTILYFIFWLIITSSHLALKTVWILINWLLQKPADQDPYCLRELIFIWFHTVFERISCLSTGRYKLICSFGQVKFSMDKYILAFLLVPGQVKCFTISTPLAYWRHYWYKKMFWILGLKFTKCLPVPVVQTEASLTTDPGVASLILGRSHTFMEIDHEIISTVILLLLLIQEELMSVTSKNMCTKY